MENGFSPLTKQNLNKIIVMDRYVSCAGRIRKIISFKISKKKATKKTKGKSSKWWWK